MLHNFFIFSYIQNFVYTVVAVLIAISAHEFAHGYVSYKLGDPTPKIEGRLTLNPFAHFNLVGTLCLIFFHMGWANPVRINPFYYKNRRKGVLMVSLAGPMMNYLLAFISMFFYGFLSIYNNPAANFFYYMIILNIGLGTFNLIPLPPLDGSNVLSSIFPQVENFYFKIRPYAIIILFTLLFWDVLNAPINFVNNSVIDFMWNIVRSILNLVIPTSTPGNYI